LRIFEAILLQLMIFAELKFQATVVLKNNAALFRTVQSQECLEPVE
jgi:hypothetical protein